MAKRKNRRNRNAPLLQIGATRDTIAVLGVLNAALDKALTLGREAPAQEIVREIGKLGGVSGVSIMNTSFNG